MKAQTVDSLWILHLFSTVGYSLLFGYIRVVFLFVGTLWNKEKQTGYKSSPPWILFCLILVVDSQLHIKAIQISI